MRFINNFKMANFLKNYYTRSIIKFQKQKVSSSLYFYISKLADLMKHSKCFIPKYTYYIVSHFQIVEISV